MLLSESTQENTASPPILVELFDELREDSVDWDFVWNHDKTVFLQEGSLKDWTREINLAWDFIFDPDKFRNLLLDHRSSFKKLKTVRKYGLILKSSYLLFSSEHYAPASLHRFLTLLGDFNDKLEAGLEDELIKSQLLDLSIDLGEHDKYQLAEEDCCSLDSFSSYVDKIVREVQILYREDSLSVEEYHTLRKRIRLLMNLYQVPAIEDMGGDTHQLFMQLYELSKQFGQEHDKAVQAGIKGIKHYREHTYTLDGEEKEKIEKVLQSVISSISYEAKEF